MIPKQFLCPYHCVVMKAAPKCDERSAHAVNKRKKLSTSIIRKEWRVTEWVKWQAVQKSPQNTADAKPRVGPIQAPWQTKDSRPTQQQLPSSFAVGVARARRGRQEEGTGGSHGPCGVRQQSENTFMNSRQGRVHLEGNTTTTASHKHTYRN